MCIYSKFWLQWEKKNLSPYAIFSDHPWYTQRGKNNPSDAALDPQGSRSRYRTAFELDKDRITNSQAFRRLEYKTQVFVTHEGDNYRTRLTHSLEVSEIARHIARALRLNEQLVESIALGHDLGHAPYGHVAETAINSWIKSLEPQLSNVNYYFCHNRHSVENVEHLEPGYDWDNRDPKDADMGFGQGLNLTRAVREGILVHCSMGYRGPIHYNASFSREFEDPIRKLSESNRSKGLFFPGSLEAQVVRIADDLAQRIHDLEDGFRSNILKKEHIRDKLIPFFESLQGEMFGPNQLYSDKRHLKVKGQRTLISKVFLNDIVVMLDFTAEQEDRQEKVIYQKVSNDVLDKIDKRLRKDRKYKENFLLTAQVAFLLHLWRKDQYIDKLYPEEQKNMRARILKYTKLLISILGKNEDKTLPPTYHIIAFLRGIMLANVIEHSFWSIHKTLDPNFGNYDESKILEEIGRSKPQAHKEEKYFMVFNLVNGYYKENKKKIQFNKVSGNQGRYCFTFENREMMEAFTIKYLEKILSSNGSFLESDKIKGYSSVCKLAGIYWLNKSEKPDATEYVKLFFPDQTDIWVPIYKLRIYFTGYKDRCPGINGDCEYSPDKICSHSSRDCTFYSSSTNYPDINRMVDFQEKVEKLDHILKKLITERIHNSSRVARMNYMGKKIILELLDIFKNNPRTMHDRVWSRLRIYPDNINVSASLSDWVNKPIFEKEKEMLPKKVLERFKDTKNATFQADRYSLIRTIINHIAGMTDRFIANEYNRVTQCGREVERQDETYFFS